MKTHIHRYDLEETFLGPNDPIVNVDYDSKDCMTLYKEQDGNRIEYHVLTGAEIQMIVDAYNKGPLYNV
jgi:hypothetical protein